MDPIRGFFLSLYLSLTGRFRSEQGATLVEYSLILVFVIVVVIVSLEMTGVSVNDMHSNIASQLP